MGELVCQGELYYNVAKFNFLNLQVSFLLSNSPNLIVSPTFVVN